MTPRASGESTLIRRGGHRRWLSCALQPRRDTSSVCAIGMCPRVAVESCRPADSTTWPRPPWRRCCARCPPATYFADLLACLDASGIKDVGVLRPRPQSAGSRRYNWSRLTAITASSTFRSVFHKGGGVCGSSQRLLVCLPGCATATTTLRILPAPNGLYVATTLRIGLCAIKLSTP